VTRKNNCEDGKLVPAPPRTNEDKRRAVMGSENEHEAGRTVSDLARLICVGGDSVCLHRDLFNHPVFDGGVKRAAT
jgi:hypothetical protein